MTTIDNHAGMSSFDAVRLGALVDRIVAAVAEGLGDTDHGAVTPARQAQAQHLALEEIDRINRELVTQGQARLADEVEDELSQRVRSRLFGVADLERLVSDPDIENVFANRWDQVFIRRADGTKERVAPVTGSNEELTDLVRQLAASDGRSERRFDRGQPWASFRLPDGSRLTALHAVSESTAFALRRHRHTDTDLAQLTALGTLSRLLAGCLEAAVLARLNILVVGGTDAGKTTLLRALLNAIPPEERLVTVEDGLELQLGRDAERHPDVLELESRQANIEGEGEVTMRDLTRLALRLSPDRLIVGEARGPEILEMFQAMSQGNDGSMGTLHARSSGDAFVQIMRHALKAPEHLTPEAVAVDIAASLDLIVHIHKLPTGRRVVSSVREVTGFDGAQVISNEVFGPDGFRRAVFTGRAFQERTMDRLIDAGLNADLFDSLDGGWNW